MNKEKRDRILILFFIRYCFGPSEVHATSGATEVGHYFHDMNLTVLFLQYNRALLLTNVTKIQERVVIGSHNLAWPPNSQKY